MMLDYGRQTQDVIFRVLQEKEDKYYFQYHQQTETPGIRKITISKLGDEMKILDPDGIVTEETREQLQEISFNQTLEIEIVNGKAELVPTGDIFNR